MVKRNTAVLCAFLAVLYFFVTKKYYPPPNPSSSCVVVTGASSGIGRHAALALAHRGYVVFAGVRKAKDGDSLTAEFSSPKPSSSSSSSASGGELFPVILDVQKAATITAAAATVGEKCAASGRTLTALVNNAGVQELTSLELATPSTIKSIFEVNVYGLIQTTAAFLPQLRLSPTPRLVNTGSVAGFVTPPFFGAYSGTKHAVEALTDAYRAELIPWGVSVSLLQPGGIDTEIEGKMIAQSEAHILSDPSGLYRTRMEAYNSGLKLMTSPRLRPYLLTSTSVTTQKIVHAIEAPYPNTRYLVGLDAWGVWALQFLPDRVGDRLMGLF